MRYLLIITALLSANLVFSQRYDDLLRFSRQTPEGTARSAAMGNAFGALGGDLSALSSNPAGIGVFRKSEISFTPLMNFNTTTSGSRETNRDRFLVGNLGFVISLSNSGSDWKGFNFGFNYSNLNNYFRTSNQEVIESASSQTHAFAMEAGTNEPNRLSAFTTGPAYDAFLIFRNRDDDYYTSVLETDGRKELVNQYKTIKEDGYLGEYTLAFGTNYNDKLYLGMTLGIQSGWFKTRSVYQEFGEEDAYSGFDSFDFFEYVKMDLTGTNLKFGAIYRPVSWLRVGAAIHTPTWFKTVYTYQTDVSSYFNTESDPSIGRDEGEYHIQGGYSDYDFNMRTPWKAVLGVAGIFWQKGILSLDYEYVDYAAARLTDSSDDYNYHGENESIKHTYTSGHNFRLGAEYRINSTFSLRGGYAFQGSPYKEKGFNYANTISGGEKIQSVSAGFGINFGSFYCDTAYTNKWGKDTTVFYFAEEGDSQIMASPVKNTYKDNQVRFTFGFRF